MGRGILGIEIGSSTIKMLEVKNKFNRKRVKHYSIIHISDDSIQDGVICDHEEVYKAILHELKKKKYRAKKTVCIVQSSLMFNRQIVMDVHTPQTIKQLLEIRIEDFIPVKENDYEVDFCVLGNVEEPGQTKQKILVVAVSQRVIKPIMLLMKKLKLTPAVITIPSESLIPLLKMKDKSALIVDLGETITSITIMYYGEQYSVHTIQYGTRNFEETGAIFDRGDFANKIRPQLEYFVISEIEKNLGRFYNEHEQEPIDKVYLIGEGAKSNQLKTYMEDILNRSIETVESLYRDCDIGDKIAEEDRDLMMNLLGAMLNA